MIKSTKNLFELNGKVAIVTGSSKGIGLAIASAFAEYGAHVVLSSRSQEAIDKAAEELSQKGYSITAQACHVGDESQRQNLVDKTLERFGRIDILVNNASVKSSPGLKLYFSLFPTFISDVKPLKSIWECALFINIEKFVSVYLIILE